MTERTSGCVCLINRQREGILIVLWTLVGLGLRIVGLQENPVNAYFDEGVYLSLMQVIASGQAALYRDIIFGHPPGVIWVGAWLWPLVDGSLFALRLVYALFCMAGFLPIYAIARRLYGPPVALTTLALLMTSPGFANWQGRTVFLELPQNVFVYTGIWLLTCVPGSRPLLQITAGALVGCSFLVKETAIPAGFMLGMALLFAGLTRSGDGPAGQIDRWAWLWFGAGCAGALGAVLGYLAQIPNCLHYFAGYYSLTKNANDTYQIGQRLYDLINGFYALPFPLTFGVIGTGQMLSRTRSRVERMLAFYAIGIALLLFLVPNRFYWRYLMPAVPVFCIGCAVWWQQFLTSEQRRPTRSLVWTFGALCALVHLASVAQYHLWESRTPTAYHEALRVLRQGPGPVFTLDPIWNAASGQPPPLWPHLGGDVHGRQLAMEADPDQAVRAIEHAPTVVLNRETMRWMPPSIERYIRQHYITVFRNARMPSRQYVEILRRRREPVRASNQRRSVR
ncbi:MAG: glycosyltransferase family 39 protein [Chloroherpetonaceae bacterium]|nr:glycosyltransferase family 39 protein [Chthonomonadaceae bacterium]MDW8208922.1 glycosyltransferase family 39 protein [Chloroherpetonaceae bacterium]